MLPVWITVMRAQVNMKPTRRPKARVRKWYSPPVEGKAVVSFGVAQRTDERDHTAKEPY